MYKTPGQVLWKWIWHTFFVLITHNIYMSLVTRERKKKSHKIKLEQNVKRIRKKKRKRECLQEIYEKWRKKYFDLKQVTNNPKIIFFSFYFVRSELFTSEKDLTCFLMIFDVFFIDVCVLGWIELSNFYINWLLERQK